VSAISGKNDRDYRRTDFIAGNQLVTRFTFQVCFLFRMLILRHVNLYMSKNIKMAPWGYILIYKPVQQNVCSTNGIC